MEQLELQLNRLKSSKRQKLSTGTTWELEAQAQRKSREDAEAANRELLKSVNEHAIVISTLQQVCGLQHGVMDLPATEVRSATSLIGEGEKAYTLYAL